MVIVDNRNFIKPALEANHVSLLDCFNNLQVLSLESLAKLPLNRRMDILLIDAQSVLDNPKAFEDCRPVINTFQAIYFFYEAASEKARQWILEQASFLPKILGECPLPMAEINWTLFSNQLQFFWSLMEEHQLLQKHMREFSLELDHVLQIAQDEMLHAKKLHKALMPNRKEEIKGINFLQKYASGDGGAGEFSDLFQQGSKVYQVLVSSESYLISSSLLGILNDHKSKEFNIEHFLSDVKNDIAVINDSKKKKSHVDLLILEIDLNQLTLQVHGKSNAELYSRMNGEISSKSGQTYKLSKSETVVILSPGFISNWKENKDLGQIENFFKNNSSLSQNDLMAELFFQIRRESMGQFLNRDATVLMMEVNRHGIHQV
jgi:hypothetical protein